MNSAGWRSSDRNGDAALHDLRQRLEEAEETLRAVLVGEVDTVRPPGAPDHHLLREARATLQRISHRYEEAADQRDAVLDALPAQMVLLDASGTIVATNRAWRQSADARGLAQPDHGVGIDYLAVCAACDPDDAPEAPRVERGLRELLAGRRESFSLEYPCHDPGGRRQFFRLMASPLASRRGAVVLHLDVTPTRLAEEARVQSELRWRRLVQTLPEALFFIEEDRVRVTNEAAAGLLGFLRPEALLGRTWGSLVHPQDREVGAALLRGLDPAARRPAVELRLARADGRPVEVEVSASSLPDAAQPGILLIARDVSGRKQAERELQQLNGHLLQAQKMEAVGRLAGGVAHDFNNLLTAINGFSELLAAQLPEEDTRHVHVREIRKAGERAAALTRQLLAFGRREAPDPRVFSLDERVRDLEAMLRRTIGEDVILEFDLEDDGSFVRADPNQVEQAIVNLVINARDAMPQGGRLELVTRRLPASAASPDGEVLLAVRDTGDGMDPEILPYIFEPFFTTKEGGKGTGLGLAMVYGVVSEAGGHVEVDSLPGSGTEIQLHWPRLAAPSVEAGPVEAPRPTRSAAASRILVVEDEPAVRNLVEQVLRAEGHELLIAEDGRRAEMLARQTSDLDLLLTDVILPGINGREVAERVTALHPGLPVLFMTGYSREELAARSPDDRDPDVLAKPFTPDQLLGRIGKALARTDGGGDPQTSGDEAAGDLTPANGGEGGRP